MFANKPRARGLSLVEMMVYCVLLSLFATIFFISLPVRNNAGVENLSLSAERAGTLLNKLHQGIANSAVGKVSSLKGGQGIIFLSATNAATEKFQYSDSGALLWRQWEYYLLDGEQIVHSSLPLEKASKLSATGVPPDLNSSSGIQKEVFASGVKGFEVAQDEGAWSLRLVLEVDGSTYQIETAARPRNS
jgi:hypothetical protein